MKESPRQWLLLVEHIGERMDALLNNVSSTAADQTHGVGRHLRIAAGEHTIQDLLGAPGIDRMTDHSSLRSWISTREEFGLLGVRDQMNPSPFSDTVSNAEVAAKLADLHNLEVTGFETQGVPVETVRQFADALDSMLAIYPRVDIHAARIMLHRPGSLQAPILRLKVGTGSAARSY